MKNEECRALSAECRVLNAFSILYSVFCILHSSFCIHLSVRPVDLAGPEEHEVGAFVFSDCFEDETAYARQPLLRAGALDSASAERAGYSPADPAAVAPAIQSIAG